MGCATGYEIIHQSGRLKDFICNPQIFMERATEIIKKGRYNQAVDGIRYIKLDRQEYYIQEIAACHP